MARLWPFGRKTEAHQEGESAKVIVARTMPVWMKNKPLTQIHDVGAFAEAGYRRHSIINACVRELASSSAEPKLTVEVRKKGEWVSVEDDQEREAAGPGLRLLRLLRNPNVEQSQFEWLEQLVMFLSVAGNNYTHKVRNVGQRISELWNLRPDRIKIKPGDDGLIASFTYTVDETKPQALPVEDVTHFKLPDPLDDYYGLSPIAAVERVADMDTRSVDYINAFFENAGTPCGLLRLKSGPVEPAERELIKAKWKAQQVGPEAFHSLAVLDADAEYQELGSRPDKLKLDFLFDTTESRICMGFGIPPIIVGVRLGLIRSTFANYREARRSLWRETLAPMYGRIEDKLTQNLASEFAPNLRIRFDLSGIEELQESEESRRKFAVDFFNAGLLTQNEGRLAVDYPEVDGGDVFKRKSTDVFEPLEGNGGDDNALSTEPVEVAARTDPTTKRRKLAQWKMIHRIADRHQGDYRLAFLDSLSTIRTKQIRDAVEEAFLAGNSVAVETALNLKSLDDPMRESFEKAIRKTSTAAAKAAENYMPPGMDLKFDLDNPLATEFAKEHSANLVQQVQKSTIEGVRYRVGKAFENGAPPKTLARTLTNEYMDEVGLTRIQRKAVDNFRAKQLDMGVTPEVADKQTRRYREKMLRRRASLIARTETIHASGMGQQALWKQAEMNGLLDARKVKREWIVTPDDRLDAKICAPMAGQKVGMDEVFVTGTGNTVLTQPAHPACRCAIALARADAAPKERLSPVHAAGVGRDFAHVADKAVKDLPQSMHTKLLNHGVKVRTAKVIPDILPELKGKRPRGWPKGTTWDDCGGCYDPRTKTIVVADHGDPAAWIRGTVNHEAGHALDDATEKVRHMWGKLSDNPDFASYYRDDIVKFDLAPHADETKRLAYFLQSGNAGRQETVAELFAEIRGSVRLKLNESFPKSHKFLREFLAEEYK